MKYFICLKALAEDFAAVLWCPLPQSDYLIACWCVALVAELAAGAARHLQDTLNIISIANKRGPAQSHLTACVQPQWPTLHHISG